MGEWISTKDRLPELDKLVLGYTDDKKIFIVELSNYGFFKKELKFSTQAEFEDWLFELDEITHWMPLPEPPKEV